MNAKIIIKICGDRGLEVRYFSMKKKKTDKRSYLSASGSGGLLSKCIDGFDAASFCFLFLRYLCKNFATNMLSPSFFVIHDSSTMYPNLVLRDEA